MPCNANALSSTHRRPLPPSRHCLPVSTEGILETAMSLSPFSTPHSDLGRPTTPGWTSSSEMPSSRCPCRCLGSPWTGLSTVVQGQWTWYTTFLLFLLENNPAVKTISTTLAHRPFRFQDTKPQFKLLYTKALLSFGKFHFSPLFWINFRVSLHSASRPLDFCPNYILVLIFWHQSSPNIITLHICHRIFQIHLLALKDFQNSYFTLQTSFLHTFSIITLNQVILVPKFLELHPLSLQAIYILMIVAFVWLYAWELGEFVLKLSSEDFKIKYTRISRASIWGLRSFLFKATR
jgi:hypothetical protein